MWFKDLVDCKKEVFDDDLIVLMWIGEDDENDLLKLVILCVVCGIGGFVDVMFVMIVDGEEKIVIEKGDGFVDVVFKVICKLYLNVVWLEFY